MKTLNVIPFTPSASPAAADQALKLAVKSMDQARHCVVLWFKEMVERKLFLELGYSSVYQYAEKELGFSSTRTGNFLLLARKLENLPRLKTEMENGDLGYSKALEVIKVANPENEAHWIEEAKKQPRLQLRQKVDRARNEARANRQGNPNQVELIPRPRSETPPASLTHRVSLELTGEQLARYEALWEKLHKCGGVPTGTQKAETLLQAMAALVEQASADGAASTGPAVQIHVHQCPDCQEATVSTQRGDVDLNITEMSRLSCDARIDEPGRRNHATIPPKTRRRVLARDRHRCQGSGCSNTRFLEVHHLVSRVRGGTNQMENLITLCGSCHRRVHQRNCPPAGNVVRSTG